MSLKLPFSLMHNNTDPDFLTALPSPVRDPLKPFDKSPENNQSEMKEAKQTANESVADHGGRSKGQLVSTTASLKSKEIMGDVDLIERYEEVEGT